MLGRIKQQQHKKNELVAQPNVTNVCIWSGEHSAATIHENKNWFSSTDAPTFTRVGDDKQAFFLNFERILSEMNQNQPHDVAWKQPFYLRSRAGCCYGTLL